VTALRDATLREGRDVPGVTFTTDERVAIAGALAAAGVEEAEVVAPAHVADDASIAAEIRAAAPDLLLSGLVYANRPAWRDDLARSAEVLQRVDLLMPLSPRRPPHDATDKMTMLEAALSGAGGCESEVGAGLPHAFQVEPDLTVAIATRAAAAGAARVTLYDTNGGADPERVGALVGRVVGAVSVPVYFHGHDDLGLATANSWAAVRVGARGLDVTVNSLGDRAGNASLEQLVVLLQLCGRPSTVDPRALRSLSELVERLSGIAVSPLAPVVGKFAFTHRSPAHLEAPGQFEAFSPGLIGTESRLV
jgi:homocitrate synthase NifV